LQDATRALEDPQHDCGDDPHTVFVYDHGTGEIADVVAFHILDGRVCVKASSCAQPRERVHDVYEVCGQVTYTDVAARSMATRKPGGQSPARRRST
jgi:hypothetical protein